MWKLAFFALFLGASFSVAAGINCYNCSWYANVRDDRSCVDELTTVGKVDCGEGYCTTSRGDYGSTLLLLIRGCSATEINDERTEFGVTVVIRSCTTELCNDGDGKATTGTGTAATETAATTGTGTTGTGTGTAATTGTGTTGTETAETTTENGDSGASTLTGMLSATIIGIAVVLKQVL